MSTTFDESAGDRRKPAGSPTAFCDFIEQRYRAFLEHAGPDAAEHVFRRLPFQDDVLDAVGVKQLPKHQSCRTGAYDCYFCPPYLLLPKL